LHKPKREPRTRSLRERLGKPPGGQKSHKGETLRQVDAPDHTVEHYPEACPALRVGAERGDVHRLRRPPSV
jgi:hypothetical protein